MSKYFRLLILQLQVDWPLDEIRSAYNFSEVLENVYNFP